MAELCRRQSSVARSAHTGTLAGASRRASFPGPTQAEAHVKADHSQMPMTRKAGLQGGTLAGASRRASFPRPTQAEAHVNTDPLLFANDKKIAGLQGGTLDGTCRRASSSAPTSAKGGTGKRWWYERARCGDDTSVRPHTWQLRRQGQG